MHAYIDLPALIIYQPVSRRTITPPNGNNVFSIYRCELRIAMLCMVVAISYALTDYTDSYICSYLCVI